jgi:hypothetical protein
MVQLPVAPSSPEVDIAYAKLKLILAQNQPKARELVQLVQNTVIDDCTREPKQIKFTSNGYKGDAVSETVLFSFTGSKRERYRIHPHALSQIATRLQIEAGYVRRLNVASPKNWRRCLLCENFNVLTAETEFSKRGEEPMRFLLRFVGDELRGFMSRSFGRHLASKPMLAAFLSACNGVGAVPADASSSAVRHTLSCYIPFVFEPTPKDFVAVGVRWTNSDFGAGRLAISLVLMSVARGTSAVLSDEYSRRHIGSIIQGDDLLEISDETATKEVETAASAIKDSVEGLLRPESVTRLMKAIDLAHQQKVEWAVIRRDLKKFLYESELATVTAASEKGLGNLPPPGSGADGAPLPTKWWMMNVLSLLAEGEQDADRRAELQQEAGKYIELKK